MRKIYIDVFYKKQMKYYYITLDKANGCAWLGSGLFI